MTAHPSDGEALLTPAEVAALFRVDPKTVTRWAKAGKLTSIRTLGGHRRYRSDEVHALLDRFAPDAAPSADAVPTVQQAGQRAVAPSPRQAPITLPTNRVDAR
jgi:excisionase family DNA binding protein